MKIRETPLPGRNETALDGGARRCEPAAMIGIANASATVYPDTPVVRAMVTQALTTLEHRLATRDSATLVLEQWCAEHRLAPPGTRIVAERVRGQEKPADRAVRTWLQVDAAQPVGYRRVRLRCGERVLSEADNWYVPARLTPAMNAELDASDVPFGRVVATLGFRRRTLSSRIVWRPRARSSRTGDLRIPATVIETRAVLIVPGGQPISLVVEEYGRSVIPPPAG